VISAFPLPPNRSGLDATTAEKRNVHGVKLRPAQRGGLGAHPIQDQMRSEIEMRADAACKEIVARLTTS
jgi:hypothetical protein